MQFVACQYNVSGELKQIPWWTNKRDAALSCEDFQTCSACQEHERCGWCDDGSNTGKGQCLEGSASGPLSPAGLLAFRLNTSLCPAPNWYFTDCPSEWRCKHILPQPLGHTRSLVRFLAAEAEPEMNPTHTVNVLLCFSILVGWLWFGTDLDWKLNSDQH